MTPDPHWHSHDLLCMGSSTGMNHLSWALLSPHHFSPYLPVTAQIIQTNHYKNGIAWISTWASSVGGEWQTNVPPRPEGGVIKAQICMMPKFMNDLPNCYLVSGQHKELCAEDWRTCKRKYLENLKKNIINTSSYELRWRHKRVPS